MKERTFLYLVIALLFGLQIADYVLYRTLKSLYEDKFERISKENEAYENALSKCEDDLVDYKASVTEYERLERERKQAKKKEDDRRHDKIMTGLKRAICQLDVNDWQAKVESIARVPYGFFTDVWEKYKQNPNVKLTAPQKLQGKRLLKAIDENPMPECAKKFEAKI